jgi:hypothetical protein
MLRYISFLLSIISVSTHIHHRKRPHGQLSSPIPRYRSSTTSTTSPSTTSPSTTSPSTTSPSTTSTFNLNKIKPYLSQGYSFGHRPCIDNDALLSQFPLPPSPWPPYHFKSCKQVARNGACFIQNHQRPSTLLYPYAETCSLSCLRCDPSKIGRKSALWNHVQFPSSHSMSEEDNGKNEKKHKNNLNNLNNSYCNIDRIAFHNIDQIRNDYLNKSIPVFVTGLTNNWELTSWVQHITNTNRTRIQRHDLLAQSLIMYLKQQFYWVQQVGKNHYSWLDEEPAGKPEALMSALRRRLQQSYVRPWNMYGNGNVTDILQECDTENMHMPPHEWILFASQGSGSPWHIDPLNTSAWNALLVGRKLWALTAPAFEPPETKGIPFDPDGAGDGPWGVLQPFVKNELHPKKWFNAWFEKKKKKQEQNKKETEVYICEQQAGEMLFVPSGFWHTVVNMEATIAVTENVAIGDGTIKNVMNELKKRKDSCLHCGECLLRLENKLKKLNGEEQWCVD